MKTYKFWMAPFAVLLCLQAPAATSNDDPFPDLQAAWWQWAFSLPKNHSPLYDKTGGYCALGQHGDVWFLAGNAGGKSTRLCTIPAGMRLFIPLINVGCTFEAAPPFDDLSDCLADTVDFINGNGDYSGLGFERSIRINDVDITAASHFGASKPFAAVVPRNGIFGYAAGMYPAADIGQYYLSAPLTEGTMKVQVTASGYGFSLDVTYHLTIIDATYPD